MKDQIGAKGDGRAVDVQWFEVPTLHCMHTWNEKLIRAIACHDLNDVPVGIDGCPK